MVTQIVVTMTRKEVDDAIHEAAKKGLKDTLGGVAVEMLTDNGSTNIIGARVIFNGTKG